MENKIRFICQDCGCTKLAEIQIHATVTSPIQKIATTEFDMTYDYTEIQDGTIERYQCNNCGFILRHTKDSNIILENQPIDNFDDLMWWLEHNCEQHHIGKLPKENKNET